MTPDYPRYRADGFHRPGRSTAEAGGSDPSRKEFPVDDTRFFNARNVLTLLDAPTSVTYPRKGGVRVDKAGIGGVGPTPVDAAADWGRNFARIVVLPNDAEEGDGAVEDDTDLARGDSRVAEADEAGTPPGGE